MYVSLLVSKHFYILNDCANTFNHYYQRNELGAQPPAWGEYVPAAICILDQQLQRNYSKCINSVLKYINFNICILFLLIDKIYLYLNIKKIEIILLSYF